MARLRYRKKANQFVTAVRLNLDTDGLVYRKWGGRQRGKRGDWLVDNHGEVYTVDARSFARKYRRLSPGVYVKATPVWAEVAPAVSARRKGGRNTARATTWSSTAATAATAIAPAQRASRRCIGGIADYGVSRERSAGLNE
jgi:hypothetical protein